MFYNRWKSEKACTVKKFKCCSFAKNKAKFNLAASSDFAVTGRRMINYIGNKTFPIVTMLVFRTKLYIQHLHGLFWFLLTIMSILSFTVFPLINAGSKISAPSTIYLTVTKIKCIWSKYTNIEAMQITSHSGIYKNLYHY